MEKRCIRLESLTIDAVSEEPPVFDANSTMTLHTSAPGSPEWWESSRSRITLQRDGETWRIASWEPRERELVDALAHAAGAGEHAPLLASSKELQTTAFVRLACQRSVDLVNQGYAEEADRLSVTAIAVAEHLGDPASLSASMSSRGVTLRAKGELERSLVFAEEALLLAQDSGDPDMLARALVRLTRTREHLKGIPDPELVEQTLGLAGDVEDVSIIAHAVLHLARAWELRGHYRVAFRYAELAARYAEESGDRAALTAVSILLHGAYRWMGDAHLAAFHGRRAMELSYQGGFDGPATMALVGFVTIEIENRNLAVAMQMLEEALRTARMNESRAMLLYTRAVVHLAMKNLDEADRDVDEAMALYPTDATTLPYVSILRAHLASARGNHQAALAHLDASGGPDATASYRSRHHRAEILFRLGRIEEARTMLEVLLSEGDGAQLIDPERSLFHSSLRPSHRLLVELLSTAGESSAALQLADEMKSADLRTALEDRKSGAAAQFEEQPPERAIEERIRELNRRLAAGTPAGGAAAEIRDQLAAARATLLDLRQRLYVRGAADAGSRSAELCPDELPAYLDDVTIVSYAVGVERTMVFVLGPKRDGRRELTVRSIEIQSDDLLDRTAHFTALVEQRNLRAPAVAAEMYELLLGPIESALAGARSLCIIPDVGLWQVPFQALGPEGGTLLVERVPLFYASSIAVLTITRPDRTEPRGEPRLLAFANPLVGAETASLYRALDPDAPLGALPETESEVRAIGRIYGSESSRIYVGETAREATLKQEAPGFDILHIATHGVMYDKVPMFSSLLLTASPEDKEEDGVLEAREIATLALNADLAVLSACETGRANLRGTGVIGLSWAFLAAGCPTTVVSQWKTHSAASAVLMVEFHRQLAAGRSKPEALRRAQLALRRDRRYRHPFYWAPFMVIGRP